MNTGIILDVSSNNGHIDFSQVESQIDGVFIRTSLGFGDVDKNCQYYAPHAVNEAIPVSYYHFAYPHQTGDVVKDATEQATYFLHCISLLPAYSDLAIDLEPKDAQGDDTTLNHDDFALWLQTFIDVVKEATGKEMIIYSYADYLNRHLPVGHTFGNYRLWLASYTKVPQPILPNGWSEYYMWQHSATGTIRGMVGNVDLSLINPNYNV